MGPWFLGYKWGSGSAVLALPSLVLYQSADSGVYTDTARTTPAVNDGDPIAGQTDQSGGGNHATQTIAGRRPTWRTGVKNGLPVVRFDGVDDNLVFPTLTLNDFSIYVVQSSTGDGCFLANTTINRQVRLGESGNNRLSMFDGTTQIFSSTLSVVRGNWSLLEYHRTGSTCSFYENGVAKGTGSMSSALALNVIGLLLGASLPLNGDLAALIVCSAENTAAQKSAVRVYLNSRYAL